MGTVKLRERFQELRGNIRTGRGCGAGEITGKEDKSENSDSPEGRTQGFRLEPAQSHWAFSRKG